MSISIPLHHANGLRALRWALLAAQAINDYDASEAELRAGLERLGYTADQVHSLVALAGAEGYLAARALLQSPASAERG